MIKWKQCVICGEDYIPTNPRQKCCGSEDCKRELARWSDRKKYAKNKAKEAYRRNVLTKPNHLNEDAMAAKESGMSYGQYKAQQLMKRMEAYRW